MAACYHVFGRSTVGKDDMHVFLLLKTEISVTCVTNVYITCATGCGKPRFARLPNHFEDLAVRVQQDQESAGSQT